jgi:hypothetical protein
VSQMASQSLSGDAPSTPPHESDSTNVSQVRMTLHEEADTSGEDYLNGLDVSEQALYLVQQVVSDDVIGRFQRY